MGSMAKETRTVKEVSVIGLFCTGKNVSDGQSIKTRIVTRELEKAWGEENVGRIDTWGWKKHPLKLFRNCLRALRDSRNVIFMTDAGGIRVFPWLLLWGNVLYGHRLHYVVVGGWLPEFLKTHPFPSACLKKFDTILGETTVMQEALREMGFTNVRRMPNFKDLTPLQEAQLVVHREEPYPFCTFSRVMRKKGIEDAVEAVRSVNGKFGRTVCTLDIYGAVDPGETEWFAELSAGFPPEVRYRGVVPFDRSVEVVKEYFALLFPTFYPSEGIPGTILDAYAAGVPVIASRWSGFRDVVEEGVTGIGYPYLRNDLLKDVMEEVIRKPGRILNMKKNCLKKAESFDPEQVMRILLEALDERI